MKSVPVIGLIGAMIVGGFGLLNPNVVTKLTTLGFLLIAAIYGIRELHIAGPVQITASIIVCLIAALFAYQIIKQEKKSELEKFENILVPGNEKTPENACSKHKSSVAERGSLKPLTIILGSEAHITNSFPFYAITRAYSMNTSQDEHFLIINRNDGVLVIEQLSLYDADDRLLVSINNEEKKQ